MLVQVDVDRLLAAWKTVRADLLSEQTDQGHWVGRLSSSPLATATAISALLIAHRQDTSRGIVPESGDSGFPGCDWIVECDLSELVIQSLHCLARQQNADGGWGDTDRSQSNIATTMLVRAAFQLTGVPAKYTDLMDRAEQYIARQGGVAGLRQRHGKDKTLTAPILANCALAGLIPWWQVPPLPFELACLPQRFYPAARLPVVSSAIPTLVAIGQVKFHHDPPRNPLARMARRWALRRSLNVVERMQPATGGFLESTPMTSFVVMSLASMGYQQHPIVQRGVEFLLESVRSDGSWPIGSNLATRNTTLALGALSTSPRIDNDQSLTPGEVRCLDWLLECQHQEPSRSTGARPGGWAWTDLPGGVPNADDTSAALLALAAAQRRTPAQRFRRVHEAARRGAEWLVDLQNTDGGWPTFCRGWSHLPSDRSASDLTAHALRALAAWRKIWASARADAKVRTDTAKLSASLAPAISAGVRFLETEQRDNGSWLPLWFGNQHDPAEENPVYGTSRVLEMCRDLELLDRPMAVRGADWLSSAQLPSGGWGPARVVTKPIRGLRKRPAGTPPEVDRASVEETSLAIGALLPWIDRGERYRLAVERGLTWLVDAVEKGQHHEPAAIGWYFARLWYGERLYPQALAVDALTSAVERLVPEATLADQAVAATISAVST